MPLFIALSLLVTSELSIIDGKCQEFLTLVQDGLEVSRSFAGNERFDIFLDQENPGKVLFIKQWEPEQHFQTYYQWRLGQGGFEALGEYFSAPPAMHIYRDLDELRGSEWINRNSSKPSWISVPEGKNTNLFSRYQELTLRLLGSWIFSVRDTQRLIGR